jgi:glyoxylase-like metal-dependent hydrolase (beta-lactamase superfamily II)
LKTDFNEKPVMVVNTHAHFDHFWGNSAFSKSTIIGHTLCRQDINRKQQLDFLAANGEMQMGVVRITPPNLTFEKRMIFKEDGLELFHSPGHTRDSISCIDHQDKVLHIGDNVGLPIPSIYPGVRVEEFIKTLETYHALQLPTIISSHYNQVEGDLFQANLEYLYKLLIDDTDAYDQGETKFFNDWNKKILARPSQEDE